LLSLINPPLSRLFVYPESTGKLAHRERNYFPEQDVEDR